MAYFKPFIDETGYHYPTYNEILEYIADNALIIFGQDLYLGNDSQDYQMFSIFAKIAFDSYCWTAAAYDAHSPRTSVGTGLDSVVSINGIRRKEGTRSVAQVVIHGTPGLVIQNGSVADNLGNTWDLPAHVTIGLDGALETTVTARNLGQIIALPGTITVILTPMLGWLNVSNPAISTVGSVIETDAQLRARQKLSTARPSASLMEGLQGAIAEIENVTRYAIYENDTSITDANSIPSHSISVVVEGGDDHEIAETIFVRKSTGCGTYGNTTAEYIGAFSGSNKIQFSRPSYVDIDVEIIIKPLPAFVAEQIDAIKGRIVDYLDSLAIGDDLTISILWWAAQEALPDQTAPSFSVVSVRAARDGNPLSSQDIAMSYTDIARGNLNNVRVLLL